MIETCEMDILTQQERSERMRLITAKNTKPELAVRRLVHKMGYRYRLHRKEFPGKPDLVFVKKKKAIFVHGCFWHQHSNRSCHLARMPKSNLDYWQDKFKRNVLNDKRNIKRLKQMGWSVLVIWQCNLKDETRLRFTIKNFMK
jgi:DNA mismatch endonuclease, patch repair protein